jgi:hypothetical protein
MGLPSLTAPSGAVIRDGIYILSQLHADPETAGLHVLLENPQELVEKAIAARRDADKKAIMANAVADFRLGAAQRGIVAYGIKVFGHYGDRSDPGYLAQFPEAPSAIANVTPGERAKAFKKLRDAVIAPAVPKDLQVHAKVLVASLDEWTAAEALSAKATDGLKAASAVEQAAADMWQTAVRKVRGSLIALFPRDVKRQRSYLPASKPAKKTKAGAGSGGATEPQA